MLRYASVISWACLRSCFTSCIFIEYGHLVIWNSQIPYTGINHELHIYDTIKDGPPKKLKGKTHDFFFHSYLELCHFCLLLVSFICPKYHYIILVASFFNYYTPLENKCFNKINQRLYLAFVMLRKLRLSANAARETRVDRWNATTCGFCTHYPSLSGALTTTNQIPCWHAKYGMPTE